MKVRLANYYQSFSFVGLVFATLFFCASVTPSLLPRNPWVQGILSGFAIAIGYGVGVALVATYQFLELRNPTGRTQQITKGVIVAVVTVVFVAFLWRMTEWQNSIREVMKMPPLESSYPLRTAAVALVWGAGLVAMGRAFLALGMYLSRKLQRFLPRRIAAATGFLGVALAAFFFTNDVVVARLFASADRLFLKLDTARDTELVQPSEPTVSGSEGSLVDWDTIGRQGKLFLAAGPQRSEIAEFLGRPAQQPVRVYVGMRTRPMFEQRAALALEELQRAGGFERSVLVIATPTGTGWLDPSAVDTLEYLHGGDTAIVSMQYSYLPSWITILVDPQRSIQSGQALFNAIYGYWKTLPADDRPRLYLHGLSLGSLGSESSLDMFTIFEDPIQGAVWSGPPFPSQEWQAAVRNRNPGTPVWMPQFRDGRLLRFTAQENHLNPEQPWGSMRNVYVQYASDPMVWFSPDLAWNRPAWLDAPRGPDVSPELRWYPIITFLQVAFDLPMATAVPIGSGHNYSPSSYADAWLAVTQPDNWNADDTARLKAKFAARETPKP